MKKKLNFVCRRGEFTCASYFDRHHSNSREFTASCFCRFCRSPRARSLFIVLTVLLIVPPIVAYLNLSNERRFVRVRRAHHTKQLQAGCNLMPEASVRTASLTKMLPGSLTLRVKVSKRERAMREKFIMKPCSVEMLSLQRKISPLFVSFYCLPDPRDASDNDSACTIISRALLCNIRSLQLIGRGTHKS